MHLLTRFESSCHKIRNGLDPRGVRMLRLRGLKRWVHSLMEARHPETYPKHRAVIERILQRAAARSRMYL